jgi:hypothetical protein
VEEKKINHKKILAASNAYYKVHKKPFSVVLSISTLLSEFTKITSLLELLKCAK